MKRILAIIAVILLGGLYVAALVLAIMDNPVSEGLLKGTFLLTLAVPVLLYVYTLLIKKAKERYDGRERGLKGRDKPSLIVMLTLDDKTVSDAISVFEQYKDCDAQYWGFKEFGIPLDEIKSLCRMIKEHGKTAVFEVVAYTEEECLDGARVAIDCGFDILMGTMYSDAINKLCRDNNIRYMPFVGNVHDRPSILEGSIEDMIAEAKTYLDKGVWGIDILAYRYTGDADELIKRFISGVDAPVCIAGSINSYSRIDTVKEASAWAFTIGSAFFEHDFGDDYGQQINDVCRYL